MIKNILKLYFLTKDNLLCLLILLKRSNNHLIMFNEYVFYKVFLYKL